MKHLAPRLEVGQLAPEFSSISLSGDPVSVPGTTRIHLQFRRFAGCPICSLHLRSFARRHEEIAAAKIEVIALFHASAEELSKYHADLPFVIIPDPQKGVYAQYGVGSGGWGAMMHPAAVVAAMRGMMTAPSNPLDARGGRLGLPADFLIDEDGRLRGVKYGTHADDHWEVDELLELAST